MASTKTIEEVWKEIPDFEIYDVSNLGRIYNRQHDMIMRTSVNNFGHVKITLQSPRNRQRYTRSVARIVAEAFCKQPNILCDQIIVLDGDFTNVAAYNLAWRPRRFAWKYTHQLKTKPPLYYENLPVLNTVDNIEYRSIVQAGMYEGLLFDDIWESTYTGRRVFPTGVIFEVVEMEEDFQ